MECLRRSFSCSQSPTSWGRSTWVNTCFSSSVRQPSSTSTVASPSSPASRGSAKTTKEGKISSARTGPRTSKLASTVPCQESSRSTSTKFVSHLICKASLSFVRRELHYHNLSCAAKAVNIDIFLRITSAPFLLFCYIIMRGTR